MTPARPGARPTRGGATTRSVPGHLRFPGVRASGVVDSVRLDGAPDEVLREGFWGVVGDFEGRVRAWRFADVDRDAGPVLDDPGRPWVGPPADAWRSSLDRVGYVRAVEEVRRRIRAGDVYQVNVCRVLDAPLPSEGHEPDAEALGAWLAAGNPAPYGGVIHVPAGADGSVASAAPAVWVVSASPELFLHVADGVVRSGPIKGTAPTADGLTAKDRAENVMIADMVRNDLQQVCRPGTVEVEHLLEVQEHPGLVHLVTTVRGDLTSETSWSRLLSATFPPASVSGAPRHTALRAIRDLEPVPRGPYCGAVGWVDADAGRAELAVGIRTFWWDADDGGRLRFGTGAGITWESEAGAEWAETELKARRLVALASADPEEGRV